MTASQIPPLEINVVIEVNFSKKSEMRAIMKALKPDNINFPKGLSMKMSSQRSTLFLEFSSTRGIKSLLNTIDEILEHISIAGKVVTDA